MSEKVVDLSHPLSSEMTVYPGDPQPEIGKVARIEKDGYNATELKISSHLGTHIDAPFHILKNGKSLNEFSLENFIGRGLCIACSESNLITADFIENALKNRKPDFLLMYTGWEKRWKTPEYFSGFPVLEMQASEHICNLGIKAIGIDAPSFDPVNAELINHKLLLARNILLIENLCNLHLLLNKEFEFYCLPLNYSGADGSPVRACAQLIENE